MINKYSNVYLRYQLIKKKKKNDQTRPRRVLTKNGILMRNQ